MDEIHNVWHPIKITRRAKKKENTTHNEEKNQSIKSDPERAQMLALVDKDTKSCYNCVPYVQKVNRDMQDIKKIPTELLGIKYTMSKFFEREREQWRGREKERQDPKWHCHCPLHTCFLTLTAPYVYNFQFKGFS